jgi:hypothetical protein
MDLLYNAGHLEAQAWAILMISQAYIGDYVGVVHYKYCVHGENAMTGLERKRYSKKVFTFFAQDLHLQFYNFRTFAGP